ncbi:hypothetical protein DRN50_08440, partial [Thermococci archaeon]
MQIQVRRRNVRGFAFGLVVALLASGILAAAGGGVVQAVQAAGRGGGGSDEGLVAEWRFDEGAGSVLHDSSGNGNDGTIHGATWTEGKFGNALRFDGQDDFVDCGNPPNINFGSGDFTVYFMAKPADFHNYQRFMTKYASSPQGWIIYGDSHGKVWANVIGTKSTAKNIPMGTYEIDAWHSYALVKTSNQIKTYMDGHLIHTFNAYVGDTDASTNLLIGKCGSSCVASHTYLKGLIDEVQIYNRALTAEEIKQQYEGKQAELTLTKSVSPHTIKQGQTTTVTLTVENTGTTELRDIEVADEVPAAADLTFVSGESAKKYDSLKPEDTRVFQYILETKEAGRFNLG